jgi:hypothetical protein
LAKAALLKRMEGAFLDVICRDKLPWKVPGGGGASTARFELEHARAKKTKQSESDRPQIVYLVMGPGRDARAVDENGKIR